MKLIVAILISVLLYSAVRMLYRKHWEDGLKVEIDFPDRIVREGDQSRLLEVITNDKWLPLPVLQIKFAITRTFRFAGSVESDVTDQYYRNEYFALRSFERVSRTYPFVCAKRGLFGMKNMDLICKDLFLSDEMYHAKEHAATLLVLPGRVPLHQIPTDNLKLLGEIETNLKLQEDPFAFAMIREYQPYDSMHSLNWKVSARMDRLMVNTFHTTLQRELVIVLNLNTHAGHYEERIREDLIRIAATLCAYFVDRKIPVALLSNGCDSVSKEYVKVAAGADQTHVLTLESALARIDTNLEMPDILTLLRKRMDEKRSEEFLIISNDHKDPFLDAVERLRTEEKQPVHLIVPYLKREGRPEEKTKLTVWEIADA